MRYCSRGMLGEDTVLTMRSRERAWWVAQSGSSFVAMKSSAPSFIASDFLAALREMAMIFSAPSALA